MDAFGPMGVMELPLRLHAARARLVAGRREDAARGLGEATRRLARQAAAIPDPQLHQRFLSEVPENVALRGLAGELGAAVDGPLAAPP